MAALHAHALARRRAVALDDISATEWRQKPFKPFTISDLLHSMISVLPNGGIIRARSAACLQLHSMISVLPNGGKISHVFRHSSLSVALDDISATEWRNEAEILVEREC